MFLSEKALIKTFANEGNQFVTQPLYEDSEHRIPERMDEEENLTKKTCRMHITKQANTLER